MTEPWHPGDDLLLDVALGHAGQDVRDRVAGHLATCPDCRRHHEDLLAGIELTLPAAPRTAPPPGFESAVLAALRGEHARPGRRRGRWLPVAAAGLLGLAVGVGGTLVVDDAREDPPVVAAATPFLAEDGSTVGSVSRGHGDDGGQLAVVVSVRAPAATVICRGVLADGSVRDLAQWELDGYGDVWLVDEPAPGLERIELVDESGTVWASARL